MADRTTLLVAIFPIPGGNIMLNQLRDMRRRVPPVYNPETDRTYRFRQYVQDVGIWSMMTDLAPHQQAAALIARLQGHARELALLLPAHEVAAGRIAPDGSYIDPVSNLLAKLAQRFAPFEDEERNESMLRVWNFARRPHEDIDSLLSRFEELRYKAAREGHYTMSIEGWSRRILQQCALSQAQALHVMEPFAYQMPHTEDQFTQLLDRLRRVGHQAEN